MYNVDISSLSVPVRLTVNLIAVRVVTQQARAELPSNHESLGNSKLDPIKREYDKLKMLLEKKIKTNSIPTNSQRGDPCVCIRL